MSTYLDIALNMKRERSNYELYEFDEESPPDRSKPALGPAINSSNSSNSYPAQTLKRGWNPVLKTDWLPMWVCSCTATVGGEWPRCPVCGEPKPAYLEAQ